MGDLFNVTDLNSSYLYRYNKYINADGTYNEDGEVLYKLIFIVLGVLVLVTNLPVVISSGVLLRKGHLEPRCTYILLGNVSLADMLVGVSTILTAFLNTSSSQYSTACIVQIGLHAAPITVSVLTLVFIAVDRYIFILHGMHYRRLISPMKVRLGMVFIWIFAITHSAMPALGCRNNDLAFESCYFVTLFSKNLLISSAVICLIPCVIIAILYSIILIQALENSKKFNEDQSNGLHESLHSPRVFRGSLKHTESLRNTPNIKTGQSNSNSLSSTAETDSESAQKNKKPVNKPSELRTNASCPNLISKPRKYDHSTISEQEIHEDVDPKPATKLRKLSKRETLQKCSDKCKHCFTTLKRQNQRRQTMIRGMAMVLLTTSGFLLVWIPKSIVILMYAFCDETSGSDRCIYLRLLLKGPFFVLLNTSCMINPFIYAWWHKGFNKAVKNYWQRCIYLAKIKKSVGNNNK